LLKAVVTRL